MQVIKAIHWNWYFLVKSNVCYVQPDLDGDLPVFYGPEAPGWRWTIRDTRERHFRRECPTQVGCCQDKEPDTTPEIF